MKRGTWFVVALLVVSTVFRAMSLSPNVGGRPVGGTLSGRVYGYNMYDEAIPLVWARVSAYANGTLVESVSTGVNGSYVMFIPAGMVNVTVVHPGFKTQARIVAISDGGSAALNFYLERSEIPIPEFNAHLLPILVMLVMVFTVLLTKRRRR